MSIKEKNEFLYHGELMKAPYFEGWYYKVTTDTIAFAIIVGISKNKQEEHAFIQTIDTLSKKTYYYRYAMDEVKISYHPFSMKVQGNYFSKHHLQLHLTNITVDVSMYEFTDLQKTAYAPTIMGPFSYYKYMQCVHSISSLQHFVRGEVTCEKQVLPITGIGYMEKDRGVSFPKEYIWAQSNACNVKNCCFFLSIAHIPMLSTSFTGCICVLMMNHKQYRFATYYGVRIKHMKMHQHKHHKEVHVTLKQGFYQMDIIIKQAHAYPLVAPADGVMEPKIFESLDSEISVKLYHHSVEMYNLQFTQAGSEIRI